MSSRKNIQKVTYGDLLKALNESSILAFTDINGSITYVNDKFCEISQYSREELLGQNHRLLKSGHHPQDFYKEIWDTISTGKVWIGEMKNKCKNGSFYWVCTTIIPFIDNLGVPYQYAAIRIDITDKKNAEEKHRKSLLENDSARFLQQNYEKFVTTLVHDLRNPLMVASISAQIIQRSPDISRKVETTAAKIISKLKRVDEMLTNVLETSSTKNELILSLTIKNCDAVSIIRAVLDDLVIIYGHRFILESINEFNGSWSPSAIQRITENLCSNAIKYGDTKKDITICIKNQDENLEISVHNIGNPIPENDLKSIFEYMHRTESAEHGQQDGWGIGLSVVAELAKAHGGSCHVKSNKAEGTIFTVALPMEGHFPIMAGA